MTDFEHITPCGGDCRGCTHYGADCAGCLSNGGKCVGMWENDCRIFECCREHNALFCGLCGEFPCEWLTEKIGEWEREVSTSWRGLRRNIGGAPERYECDDIQRQEPAADGSFQFAV